jgi:polyisoprenoid-binding protein YceI
MFARFLFSFALGLAAAGSAAAAERPLTVDTAQSRIDVVVKASMDSFTGQLTRYDAVLTADADGKIAGFRLNFRFLDVVTGKEGRDKAMHKWQETDKFPDCSFVLATLSPAEGGGYTAFGRLTFHGVTRDLRFPVTIARDGARYAIDGDAALDTREFGLPIIRMFALLKVDPMVHIRFHLQAQPAS